MMLGVLQKFARGSPAHVELIQRIITVQAVLARRQALVHISHFDAVYLLGNILRILKNFAIFMQKKTLKIFTQ